MLNPQARKLDPERRQTLYPESLSTRNQQMPDETALEGQLREQRRQLAELIKSKAELEKQVIALGAAAARNRESAGAESEALPQSTGSEPVHDLGDADGDDEAEVRSSVNSLC